MGSQPWRPWWRRRIQRCFCTDGSMPRLATTALSDAAAKNRTHAKRAPVQPIRTARGRRPQQRPCQRQLTGHKDAIREDAGVGFSVLLFSCSQRISSRFLASGLCLGLLATRLRGLARTYLHIIIPRCQMHLSSSRHGPSAAIANFAVQRKSAACWRGSFQR